VIADFFFGIDAGLTGNAGTLQQRSDFLKEPIGPGNQNSDRIWLFFYGAAWLAVFPRPLFLQNFF
jgi:hypothetical protein